MNGATQSAAAAYLSRGWAPTPVEAGGKRPVGVAWQAQSLKLEDIPQAFSGGRNIGLLVGERSGGLVDVDVDHPVALNLARLLPETKMIHGRTGNPSSHYWYQVDGESPATAQFKDPMTGHMLIELRSTGGQTVVPPSRYNNPVPGESVLQLDWVCFEQPGVVSSEQLRHAVARVAAITLVAIHWKQEGSRHATALALAGFLLRGGYSTAEAESFIEAVCEAAGDDEVEDRVATVAYTEARLAADEPATGATTLAGLLDEKIVSTLQKWLGIRRTAGSATYRDGDIDWDSPILFDAVNTPEIPASLLPGVYGSFASALAEAAEVPEAMTTTAVMGAISAAVAKRFVVSPQGGWDEPVNLYILPALPPGNLKSLVVSSVTQPLNTWEFNQRLVMEPAILLAKSKRKNEESRIHSLRAKAAKERTPPARQKLFDEVNRLEAELTEIPVPPQVYVNDVTPETLSTVACEQKGRIAIISDEGGIFEVMAGLYSKGQANYDILLKGIDGGRVRLRRKDRDLDINPYITLLLVVQPQIIRNMADKKAFQGRGLLERFLYVLPKSRLGYRSLSTQPMPDAVRTQYHQALQKLLNIAPIFERGGCEMPRVLQLDAVAMEIWTAFRHEIEAGLRPDGKFSSCLGWGGKIAGFTLRIAGLLQIAEHGGSILTIDSINMARAVQMARLLVEHALAAFRLMQNDEAADDAQAIYAWLSQLGQPQFRRTECQRKFHGRFTGKKRFDAALGVLIDRSIISPLRSVTTTEGKRPTGFYEVNPAILSLAPHVS